MPKADREHFETYRQQTRIKHEILQAYLPAFFHILKRTNKNLLYIDAFAGRGTYTDESTGEEVDGSPLRALRLIAGRDDFSHRVSTVFVESDRVNFASLERAVSDFYAKNTHIRKPEVLHGTFADKVGEIIGEFSSAEGQLAPTFLFVDPCGVEGTSFEVIKEVMQFDSCEAFIFFNYQAVRRIAGLKTLSPVLVDLYGSPARAKELLDALKHGRNPYEREQIIVTRYKEGVHREMAAPYIVAFRVESRARREGSHYLLHVTKYPLGFKIMKDVMWPRGRSVEGTGALGFAQATGTRWKPLLRPDWESMKQRIVKALRRAPAKVSSFYVDWAMKPDDLFCEAAYRKALLELEADEVIEVLDKQGKKPCPTKPKGKRRPGTLAKSYYVRLHQPEE